MADEDLDAASDLPVLDLEDGDLGVRTEDRYAVIPPGRRLIRRREHEDRDRGPAVFLLVGLALLFAAAAWLDGISSDDPGDSRDENPVPGVLEQETGATLVAVGDNGAVTLEVDERTADLPVELVAPVVDAVSTGTTLVVRDGADGVTTVPDVERGRELPTADRLVPSVTSGRVWLVEEIDPDTSRAIEVDLALDDPTAERVVNGTLVGATSRWLVVRDAAGALQLVPETGAPVSLGEDVGFLASSADNLATRKCALDGCELVLTQDLLGVEQRIDLDLGRGGQEVALFSPDGRRLAVVRSDGLESFGVIVDVDDGTVTRFRSRALAREANRPLAWSGDGAWLFLATVRNGLDTVAVDGAVARVDVELPETEALLLTE